MAKQSLMDLVSCLSSDAGPEVRFVNDLIYSIEKDADKNTRVPSKTFKPSSIGGCPRRIYYQLVGAEKDTGRRAEAGNVGILESGTDRHERLQKAICRMRENGLDCDYVDVAEFVKEQGLDYIEIKEKKGMETKCFWKEIPLSFLTDGIIRYEGKYYILEIKTMGKDKFYKSTDVRDEHKAQGICYSMAFHIPDVIYLYENRDTLGKKAFLFHVTEGMKQDLMDKVNSIKECVSNNTPPEVQPSTSKCRYCEYAQMCQKDGQ